MNPPEYQAGLTLAELLIALAVAGILVVAGTTALPRFVQEGRMVTAVNRFATALALARSEAVMRNRRVVLCPSRDRRSCGGSRDWRDGWLLFASDDRTRDPDEPLLQAGSLTGTGIRLAGNRRTGIVFQPDGSSGGSNATFTFCERENRARPRVICLSNTGRARLSDRTCGGQPVRCP